jgi:Flp pilus assembly protein TadG
MMRALRHNRAGTAAVEFALVGPVFLILLLGVAIYGVYFTAQIAIVAAAGEGARASVTGLSVAERSAVAVQTAQTVLQSYAPLLSPASAQVSAGTVNGNNNMFQVTVSYTMPFNSPLIPLPTTQPSFTATVSNGGY